MWTRFRRRFSGGHGVDLNNSRTRQRPQETAVNEFPWNSDDARLDALYSFTLLSEGRTLHPSALPSAPRAQTSCLHEPPSLLWPELRDHGLTTTQEKCYDPRDPTLRFVDREDELDFLCEGFKSLRALMSCGHAVTPTSLTNWCLRQLDEGESRFVCGQSGCNVEWSYAEVCKMALLTRKEKKHFEKAMTSNATMGSKSCPGCKSPVLRMNQSNLRVRCTVCTTRKRRIYDFCWQCLREWEGPPSRSDHCDNDGCCNESLKTLTTCPDADFESVEGVTGCPSVRACPTCGILIQHDNTQCKNVVCPRCKVEFCFVCLKLTDDCLITSEEFIPCSSRVAPRQTSIPVWRK